jgi:2-polyprenyl-6-methoxyphenol hydroxylase-like FAD-dependent oxidoreductase
MENKTPKRILIVGGGFAGLTVAMELERESLAVILQWKSL